MSQGRRLYDTHSAVFGTNAPKWSSLGVEDQIKWEAIASHVAIKHYQTSFAMEESGPTPGDGSSTGE